MTNSQLRSVRFLAAAILVALTVAACGGGDDQGVVFGSGELPETVPADFPLPDIAQIGATMVDSNRGVTEVNAVIPAAVQVVARYFDTNLVNRGYVVESSSGTEAKWEIAFAKEGLDATISLQLQGGQGVTVATVRFNST